MNIDYATLETCAQAGGLVVVIDVIRAFTTACYAIEAGIEEIILVGEVEEALALRQRIPNALIMGEVGGNNVYGFDYGNSPAALDGLDLTGCTMIQRTSSGTQGVVLSTAAETILAASFVCVGATARYIQSLAPPRVTLVVTGIRPDNRGDEDAACADYLARLLQGDMPDPEPYL
jgi:2-phosphosulfolactate phosphatase